MMLRMKRLALLHNGHPQMDLKQILVMKSIIFQFGLQIVLG
jgi:hypothetical protein